MDPNNPAPSAVVSYYNGGTGQSTINGAVATSQIVQQFIPAVINSTTAIYAYTEMKFGDIPGLQPLTLRGVNDVVALSLEFTNAGQFIELFWEWTEE